MVCAWCQRPRTGEALVDSPIKNALVHDPREDVPGRFLTGNAILDAPAEDDLKEDVPPKMLS